MTRTFYNTRIFQYIKKNYAIISMKLPHILKIARANCATVGKNLTFI